MAQHDPAGNTPAERLKNVDFPTARDQINKNLHALQTANSGSTAPAVTEAHMFWLKTVTNGPDILNIRNANNSAWVEVGAIPHAGTGSEAFIPKGIIPLTNGGTGATSKAAAQTALFPDQSGESGKALTTNGSVLSWGDLIASSHTRFDATGSRQTGTKPDSGTFVIIMAWGGGGGGAGYALNTVPGGGGGACALFIIPFSLLTASTYTVTVGAGGTAGGGLNQNGSGGAGGNSSFGSLVTAHGGGGGLYTGPTAGEGGGFGGTGATYLGGSGPGGHATFGGGGGGGG